MPNALFEDPALALVAYQGVGLPARAFPSVRHLSVSGAWASASEWPARFPHITSLFIPELPPALLDAVLACAPWSQLTRVMVDGPAASVERLAPGLRKAATLSALRVRNTRALPSLLDAWPALQSLDVDSQQFARNPPCDVDDAQLVDFARSAPAPLAELRLTGTFGVQGITALVDRGLPLRRLFVSSRHFNAECVRRLMTLPQLTHIETNLTDPSLDSLRAAPSLGRWLGPTRTLVGPQRPPIWSHEP